MTAALWIGVPLIAVLFCWLIILRFSPMCTCGNRECGGECTGRQR